MMTGIGSDILASMIDDQLQLFGPQVKIHQHMSRDTTILLATPSDKQTVGRIMRTSVGGMEPMRPRASASQLKVAPNKYILSDTDRHGHKQQTCPGLIQSSLPPILWGSFTEIAGDKNLGKKQRKTTILFNDSKMVFFDSTNCELIDGAS